MLRTSRNHDVGYAGRDERASERGPNVYHLGGLYRAPPKGEDDDAHEDLTTTVEDRGTALFQNQPRMMRLRYYVGVTRGCLNGLTASAGRTVKKVYPKDIKVAR